jgi:hypothetical protein
MQNKENTFEPRTEENYSALSYMSPHGVKHRPLILDAHHDLDGYKRYTPNTSPPTNISNAEAKKREEAWLDPASSGRIYEKKSFAQHLQEEDQTTEVRHHLMIAFCLPSRFSFDHSIPVEVRKKTVRKATRY